MAHRYQLLVDKLAIKPIRDSWEEAAQDAVDLGHGYWVSEHCLKLAPGVVLERSNDTIEDIL